MKLPNAAEFKGDPLPLKWSTLSYGFCSPGRTAMPRKCQAARKRRPGLECAAVGAQYQAAGLTGCRAHRDGLAPSALCRSPGAPPPGSSPQPP